MSAIPSVDHDFCLVKLPATWQRALDAGRVPHKPGEALVVQAVANDGASLFADSYLNGVRQFIWLRDGGADRTTVLRFDNTDQQVFGASFDGRWVVFAVQDVPTLDSSWTMYAWDSTVGGKPRTLTRSTVPGPEPYTALYHGVVYWTQAVNADRTQLHRVDLAAGTDSVIRDGVPNVPFVFGSLVVWTEMKPGEAYAPIQMQAADAQTGQLTALPPELKVSLTRPAFENADADSFVWSGRNPDGLRVWQRGDSGPTTILSHTPSGQNLQWPQVAGHLVAWDNGQAQFVADLRSHSYAQITPQYGSTKLTGDVLLVGYAPTEKTRHPVLEWSLLHINALPQPPGCGA